MASTAWTMGISTLYCYLADGELLYTKYIPAASLQTLLPYIEKEQLSVGFVGKDFCRFNLINDLSRDFAKKLELGAGDVAMAVLLIRA